MNKNYQEYEYALSKTVKIKLTGAGIIDHKEEIRLEPCHTIQIGQDWYSHYYVHCIMEKRKYFLKALKLNDGILHCNNSLRTLKTNSGCLDYPEVLVPPFDFGAVKYFITSFIAARNLDELVGQIPIPEWESIGDKIYSRLQEIERLHAERYSEQGRFISTPYYILFMEKLHRRFSHRVVESLPKDIVEIVCGKCASILQNSTYSSPTLLHMDVKPANVLYNRQSRKVYLIDFEFARFGDLDYGWAQILLSGLNAFNPIYRKHIYPNIVKHRTDLTTALQSFKMRCYILYQTLCNMIYYSDHGLPCPQELEELFYNIFEQFT